MSSTGDRATATVEFGPDGRMVRCHSNIRTVNLEERICEVCYCEDDGRDDGDADENRGGSEGSLILTEARANYLRFGACEESMVGNVRPSRRQELPDQRHAEPDGAPDRGGGK